MQAYEHKAQSLLVDFCGANHNNTDKTDPAFQAYWVKSYCTYNGKNSFGVKAVHPFISFYPYIILCVAIGLFFIDKIVEILFNNSEKLDKFYKIQVLLGNGQFFCVQHWGRTGAKGQMNVDGTLPAA